MKPAILVNSKTYWDGRFNEDWEEYQGPSQSRFFAKIAIEHSPSWFIEQLRRENLTLADWGCAQGDGTDVWASYIAAKHIVGVDFSSIAVQQANQRYSSIRFLHENWLETSDDSQERYDVVFSSNTLEHFHDPYDVLEIISRRATKAVALALPYKELERIDEHLFSFIPENIPSTLQNGFKLVWSKVIDCSRLPNTFWNGDQIILIYAAQDWISPLKLTLGDLCIEQHDITAALNDRNLNIVDLNQQAEQYQRSITDLNQQAEQYQRRITDSHKMITESNEKIIILNNTITAQQHKIVDIEFAKERMHTNLMSLSDWANQINTRPIRYGVSRYLRAIVKLIYHLLPFSLGFKQALKNKIVKSFTATPAVITQQHAEPEIQDVAGHPIWKTRLLYTDPIHCAPENSLLNERDIFIFSVIDWDFRIQRPQHLARSFAKAGQRVFFFSNHFVDSPSAGYDIQKLDPELELYQVKLHVSGAPAIYFAPPTEEALTMIKHGIARLMFDFASISSVSIVQHAYWYPLAFNLPNSLRIYDCMDHHEGFGNVPEQLIEIEKNLLSESDLVVVTSSWLETLAQKYTQNIAIIRNAGEYEHFCTPPVAIYQDTKHRKIIGYYGAIAEWFDVELIRALAQATPDALILLVGNDTINAKKALRNLSNIQFTGEVTYDQLPYYLHAFDVCLLPFQIMPLTMATNPVKVYEYLAAGKPVVSVDLPEITQFGSLVQRASTQSEFIRMVSNQIASKDNTSEMQLRLDFAREQTWDHRIKHLIQVTESIVLPKISIIVLTYNNLDLTKTCLDSLLRWNDYPNLEILVVDNASTDETPTYLKEFQAAHPDIILLLNDKNLGFSAGNNVGLKVATGDYLVVLNNDTVVTPGWLLTMVRHFQNDPTIGLIGPVTNNIGNEAKIAVHYETFDQMLPLALTQVTTHMSKSFPLKTAAFFCVMIPRPVFEQVGFLDENFGLGFFEDDDYCRRIEQLGKKIICVEDVFIHHHLSASFNKLKNNTRQALFEKNKAYYESKWGHWVAHEYRN